MVKGLTIGLKKGHVLTKIEIPSNTKEKRPRKRVNVIRKVVHLIIGQSTILKKSYGNFRII